jgi:hypothetical protein
MRDVQQQGQQVHVVQTAIIEQYILTSKSMELPDSLLKGVQAALQLAAL